MQITFIMATLSSKPDSDNHLVPTESQILADREAKNYFFELREASDPEQRKFLSDKILTLIHEVQPELTTMVNSVLETKVKQTGMQSIFQTQLLDQCYWGTLEVLLDVEPLNSIVSLTSKRLSTRNQHEPNAELLASPGLAGTGAQGRVNPYPGDIDLGENIRLVSEQGQYAAELLVKSIQDTVKGANEPTKHERNYLFLGMSAGTYPDNHPDSGGRINWTPNETLAGCITWKEREKVRTYSLAQALADPGQRVVNTYWRGPIDRDLIWGEITKVMTYEATDSGFQDSVFFETPNIGQDYQTVSLDEPKIFDLNRIRLIEALYPQIRKYYEDGNYLKANKRAYTTARLFNDIEAQNSLAPLLSGEIAHLHQLIEQLEMFIEEIIAPDGIASHFVSAADARHNGHILATRVYGFDARLGDVMARVLAQSPRDFRANWRLRKRLILEILKPLTIRVYQDEAYQAATLETLTKHSYFIESASSLRQREKGMEQSDQDNFDGDQAWLNGELSLACTHYERSLALDANNWHSAIQLLWIKSCFELIPDYQIKSLDRSFLSDSQRSLLELLREKTMAALGSNWNDWDVKKLAATAPPNDRLFWLDRAKSAADAGQYGLAKKLLEELCRRETDLYAIEPPKLLPRVQVQAENHLARLRS